MNVLMKMMVTIKMTEMKMNKKRIKTELEGKGDPDRVKQQVIVI